MTDLRQKVQWLLDNQYAIIVDNTSFTLTQKFYDDLGLRRMESPAVTTPAITPTIEAIDSTDKKAIWNKFCDDAEIPWRVKNNKGETYTVRQYSKGIATWLMTIIKQVDYKILVESTKNYYKTVTYKALLSNYLEKDIWRGEYEQWKNKHQKPELGGGSKWES